MFSKMMLPALCAFLLLSACRPKPINIDIPQKGGAITISSACIDAHTVYVSASYSVSSLVKVLDTTTLKDVSGIPKELLIDSAIITLRAAGGNADTLRKISPGLYGRKDLQLQPGVQYTLTVVDYTKGTTAFATTTYEPRPIIDSLLPIRVITKTDTTAKLRMMLSNVAPGSYYFVSYNTMRNAREHAVPLPMNAHALNFFTPKQIALFASGEAVDGKLDKAITMQVAPTDTVFVQVAKVDKAYYDYLAAYKRTGALINQLTGEPINLPSNSSAGLGFFSLYQPLRAMYNLNRY